MLLISRLTSSGSLLNQRCQFSKCRWITHDNGLLIEGETEAFHQPADYGSQGKDGDTTITATSGSETITCEARNFFIAVFVILHCSE
jgi:hypothetical protein